MTDGNLDPAAGPRPRRFFLHSDSTPQAPRLDPEDERHAHRTLRVRAGDRIEGLDGCGRAWPLEVVAAGRGGLELTSAGAPRVEPAPGEEGSPVPWIEVAAALPKGARAETMLAGLVALGAAAFTPLRTRFSHPGAGSDRENRRRRLERTVRETCKQSGRLWPTELRTTLTPDELAADLGAAERVILWLDPHAGPPLLDQAHTLEQAIARSGCVIAIGPEGGFADDEVEALRASGAVPARLGPWILRIEIAAQAALAIVTAAYQRSRSRNEQ